MKKTVQKPVLKKQVRANVPRYFRATDLLLAAVQHARDGHPVKAAKKLMEAAQAPEIDQAMQQLNDQQQTLQDSTYMSKAEGPDCDMQDQDQLSRTLARLIQASQQQQDEGDDQDDGDDGDDDQDDQDDQEQAGMDEGLDLGMEMDDQDDQSDTTEQQVQASVSSRLARAERNKARRA